MYKIYAQYTGHINRTETAKVCVYIIVYNLKMA